MTINIFVLKGEINGKIVVVRFLFVGYISWFTLELSHKFLNMVSLCYKGVNFS